MANAQPKCIDKILISEDKKLIAILLCLYHLFSTNIDYYRCIEVKLVSKL